MIWTVENSDFVKWSENRLKPLTPDNSNPQAHEYTMPDRGEVGCWLCGKDESEHVTYGPQKFHACFCDPPYGISFMGKEWDKPDASFRRTKNPSDVGRKDVFGRASRTSPEYSAGLAFQSQVKTWGDALLPLLYPGALVFMFSGTRMWHRLAAGMEDAGFELWDTMMWLHGQGFPKAQAIDALIDKANGDTRPVIGQKEKGSSPLPGNHDRELTWADGQKDGVFDVTQAKPPASRPWSGHKTCALKPAWEPVLCFKAPTGGKTYAELALEHGSGALNVDGGRIGTAAAGPSGGGRSTDIYGEYADGCPRPTIGRYPANLALECTCETVETVKTVKDESDSDDPNYKNQVYGKGMGGVKWTGKEKRTVIRHTNPECPAFMLDAQAGELTSGRLEPWHTDGGKEAGSLGKYKGRAIPSEGFGGDTGGPSRFFYCAKASRSEREDGLRDGGVGALRDGGRLDRKVYNSHPTVKPIKLNQWLATLLLPPSSVSPRRLLVPFSGVGSEMIGAMLAGWDEIVGVEQDAEYCEIARARLKHWEKDTVKV